MKVDKKGFLEAFRACVWENLHLPFPPVWAEKKNGNYVVTYTFEQILESLNIKTWDERYYVCFHLPSPRPDWEKRIRISKKLYNKIKNKIQFQVAIEEVYDNSIFPIYCVTSVRALLSEREHS